MRRNAAKERRPTPRWLKEVLAWILFIVCVSIPSALLFAFAHDVARMSETGTRDAQLAERTTKAADLRREIELALWRQGEVLRNVGATSGVSTNEVEAALVGTESLFSDPFILKSDGKLLYPRPNMPRANIVRALLVDQVTEMPLLHLSTFGNPGPDNNTPHIVRPGGSVILHVLQLSKDTEIGFLMHEASVIDGARHFLPSNLELVRRGADYTGMLSLATIAQFQVRDPLRASAAAAAGPGGPGSGPGPMLVWQQKGVMPFPKPKPFGSSDPAAGAAASAMREVKVSVNGNLPGAPSMIVDSAANVILAQTFVMNVSPKDPAAAEARALRSGKLVWAFTTVAVVLLVVMATLFFVRSRRAVRLAELRTDFVASVSHELRTPLASIQMLSELLEAGAVNEEERPEIERTLAGEARRLTATLNRMLRFGALERGKLTVDRKLTKVKDLFSEAKARLCRLHPDKNVDISLDGDDELVAEIDPVLVGLAVDNLLLNAAKYAPDGGPYKLQAKFDGRNLVINVADRGPGLDARAKKKIFLPFERADNRLARATEGTGVGLALVRGIARAHGGDATVESTPGEGAIFTIRLGEQARRSEAEEGGDAASSPAACSTHKRDAAVS